MIAKKVINGFILFLQVSVITVISMCSITNISCKISAEGIKLLKGDYQTPELKYYKIIDSRTIDLCFSKGVNLYGCSVSTDDGDVSMETEISYNDDCSLVSVHVGSEMEVGKTYNLFGMVDDEHGNSLTFSIPFTGFNSRIPEIVMTEIQSSSVSQTTREKNEGIYRNEFIEFLCLTDGNLAGLEILSGYDGESKKYEFPVVEVKAGEIIVVHLRKRGEGCISEIGEDLNQAFASYTSPSIRDLWGTEESTLLGNKTDVIIVRNQFSGNVVDGVLYRESSVLNWSKDMEAFAILAADAGIYESYLPEAAEISDGLTDTKTFSRINSVDLLNSVKNSQSIEYPVKKSSWEVTAASPGIIQ